MDERKIKSIFKELITEFLNPFKKNIEKEFSELKKSTQHISNSVDEQKTNLDKVVCELQHLRVENGKLHKRIGEIEVKIAALETQSTENERIVNQGEATNSSLYQTEEAISEWKERKKRSKNIITNISESTKNDKTQRTLDEIDKVQRLLSDIQQLDRNVKVFRLGKFDPNEIRLVKVIFNTEKDAKQVFFNKTKLPGSVKVFFDQTMNQREYYKHVKDKLKEMVEKGDTSKTIKYVNSVPKIVNLKNK
ncbi:hypothetical protein JTB14_011913 [Gonioctena quinquepunctata]|nr:hypothetical protein JTB14_011913 [Gonioctena quinquepunctata]